MSTVDSPSQPLGQASQEVDPTFKAARVSMRPIEYVQLVGGGTAKVLGHYRAFGQTAAILAGANAKLGVFRWMDPNSIAVILRLYATISVVTAITAQRTDPVTAAIARAYTVRDLTNATQIVLTGNNNKMRTVGMGSSLLNFTTVNNASGGSFDVANAAAGLTGGTSVLDANPFGAFPLDSLVAIGRAVVCYYDPANTEKGAHPVVLLPNEGFAVSWGATALATGTAIAGIGVDWAEAIVY